MAAVAVSREMMMMHMRVMLQSSFEVIQDALFTSSSTWRTMSRTPGRRVYSLDALNLPSTSRTNALRSTTRGERSGAAGGVCHQPL